MKTVIVGIGIPGAGKTTILKKLADDNSFVYIAPDQLKIEKLGRVDDHSMDKEIWRDARAQMKEALDRGGSVVFDSTFSKPDRREYFNNFARDAGAEKLEALYFDVPLDIVLARNKGRGEDGGKFVPEDIVRESFENLRKDPPKADEGFDTLLRVDEHGMISTITSKPDSVLLNFLNPIP